MKRMTRQRAAVYELLEDTSGFRSAQQLHSLLADAGHSVGLATVYRTLTALAEAGEVDVLRAGDGESLFRRCVRTEHHHHLVCRECGRTVEIDAKTVESWATRVAQEHNFVDVDHTAEIFGLCSTCAAAQYTGEYRA
ncbi:MAG TPA: Fur family transcriptional regulator [Beutenbergiaceae bacterium]|nr:Fur family transcriptional regulator [Beutenbergiaceae bacterium]